MSRVTRLVDAAPWLACRFATSSPHYPPSTLCSRSLTTTRFDNRFVTQTKPRLSTAAARLSFTSSSITSQPIVPIYISRRPNSTASSIPPLEDASIDPQEEAIIIESNTKRLKEAFSQLSITPEIWSTEEASKAFLEILDTRPLHLDIVYDYFLKFLRLYRDQIRAYRHTLHDTSARLTASKIRQWRDIYVLYRNFWKETARHPGISTQLGQTMTRTVRQHQLGLLMEIEYWSQIGCIVEEIWKEAKLDKRSAELGVLGKAERDKSRVEVDAIYGHLLGRVVRRYSGFCKTRERVYHGELQFLLPILTVLSSSPKPDHTKFASSQLFELYSSFVKSVLSLYTVSDPTKRAVDGRRYRTRLYKLAATVSSSLERSPGLSSPGLLGLLVTDLEKGGPDLYSSFSVRLAELIEREGLELDEDTANTIIRGMSLGSSSTMTLSFVRYTQSRAVHINTHTWKILAANMVMAGQQKSTDTVCMARLYELVPEDQRQGVEKTVARTLKERQWPRFLDGTRVKERATKRVCAGSETVDDGVGERQETTVVMGRVFEGKLAEVKVKAVGEGEKGIWSGGIDKESVSPDHASAEGADVSRSIAADTAK